MKKVIVFLLSLSLVFSLSACSSGGSGDQTKQTTTSEQTTEQQTEATTQAKREETTTEQTTAAKADSKGDDVAKLEGVALLKKIGEESFKRSENFYVEMKIESAEMPNEEMTMIMCEQGGNLRYEMNAMGNHHISITTVEEGYTYSYNKGEKSGYKFKYGDDFEAMDIVPDFSFEEGDLEDEATFEGLVTARYDKLDGHKVVYMEMKDFDEVLGEDVTNKIWYSVKHHYPLKTERTKVDGAVLMVMNVVEIEIDKDFSEYFKIPEDVEFETY